MKDYLIDVPVKINIWIRPTFQRMQFEVIKKARPSIIFLQSDGGRNESEWKAILENRRLFDEEIDWNCKVYKLYESINNGLYSMAKKTRELIWSTVDRCVFLEDDQIPSVSFFRYCAELLEKYKDDQRIQCICGMNHLGISENVTSDYFFSRQGSIWGVATWKRVINERNNFDYYKDQYIMRLLKERTKKNPTIWKRINAYGENDYYEGHVAGSEFWIEFSMYSQNRVQIIPRKNMIKNLGNDVCSTHSSGSSLSVFNLPIYELDFPMKHPDYVIPDVEYEQKRNRTIHYNPSFFLVAKIKITNFLKRIRNHEFKYLFCRLIGKRPNTNNEYEK